VYLARNIIVHLAFFFKPGLYGVTLSAERLKAVAHPFISVHSVREDVVNVVSWRNSSEALASSADRML
jgi:hypothetical protein